MATSWDTQLNFNPDEGENIPSEPLGIKAPLLPPKTLGQNLLNLVFLSPLGTQPVSAFDGSSFSLGRQNFLLPDSHNSSVLQEYQVSRLSQSPQSPAFREDAFPIHEQVQGTISTKRAADLSGTANSAIAPAPTEPAEEVPKASSGSVSALPDADPHIRNLNAASTGIPESWSSIDELLSGSLVTDGELPVVEPLWQEMPWLVEEVPMVTTPTTTSGSGHQGNPSSNSGKTFSPQNSKVEIVSRAAPSPKENPAALKAIAESVYHLIKQRLEIERERHGSYYSGRLPW